MADQVHVVMEQPEYEAGNVLLVCQDAEDADRLRARSEERDVIVVSAMWVPAGGVGSVYRQQVWRLWVAVEPGADGLWYPGPFAARSELRWCAEDPPAEATVETVSRDASSKPHKYVVRGTGPTPQTTNDALQEKLTVLLDQLAAGKLR